MVMLAPPAATLTQPAVPPRTSPASLDADELIAMAEALLAASDASSSARHPNAVMPAPANRGRHRGPADASAAGLAARDAMITQNLPLVRYVANAMARHVGQSVLLDYDDLLSYGTEGLIGAVDTFDAGRGLKFSTWAVMHIRTTIQDALRSLDPMSRGARAKGKAVDQASAALAHAQGVWPAIADVAAALGQPVAEVRKTLDALSRTVTSLDQALGSPDNAGDEGGISLADRLADEDPAGSPEASLDQQELSRLVAAAIAALPEREQRLVTLHYQQGLTMRTIAQTLGVSESRISQLHARAVRLLRTDLNHALFADTPMSLKVAPKRRTTVARRPLALHRPDRGGAQSLAAA